MTLPSNLQLSYTLRNTWVNGSVLKPHILKVSFGCYRQTEDQSPISISIHEAQKTDGKYRTLTIFVHCHGYATPSHGHAGLQNLDIRRLPLIWFVSSRPLQSSSIQHIPAQHSAAYYSTSDTLQSYNTGSALSSNIICQLLYNADNLFSHQAVTTQEHMQNISYYFPKIFPFLF